MTRKPIQIAMAQWDETGEQPALVVLCDDGTLWELQRWDASPTGRAWRQLPNLPQD